MLKGNPIGLLFFVLELEDTSIPGCLLLYSIKKEKALHGQGFAEEKCIRSV